MQIYLLKDRDTGTIIMYNDTNTVKCPDFKNLCDTLTIQYGRDIFVLQSELEKRGFKKASLECIYTLDEDKYEF